MKDTHTNNAYVNSIVKQYPVLGCDISKWQRPVNFQIMARKVEFVIIRAGYSYHGDPNVYQDSEWNNNWNNAKIHKIPRGAYWYFVPDVDPVAQAKKFVDLMMADRPEVCPFIDLEENVTKEKPSEIRYRVQRFLQYVEGRMGMPCGIYTSWGFVTSNLEHNFGIPIGQRPIWIANYNRSTPMMPPGIPRWDFWQFSADKPANMLGRDFGAYSASIDLNVWNGDHASFYRRFNIRTDNIVSTIPTEIPKKIKVVANAHIMATPQPISRIKGYAYFNSIWDVVAIEGNTNAPYVKVGPNAYIALKSCKKEE